MAPSLPASTTFASPFALIPVFPPFVGFSDLGAAHNERDARARETVCRWRRHQILQELVLLLLPLLVLVRLLRLLHPSARSVHCSRPLRLVVSVLVVGVDSAVSSARLCGILWYKPRELSGSDTYFELGEFAEFCEGMPHAKKKKVRMIRHLFHILEGPDFQTLSDDLPLFVAFVAILLEIRSSG